MPDIKLFLKNNWEIVTFAVVCIISIAAFAVFFPDFSSVSDEMVNSKGRFAVGERVLTEKSFGFVKPAILQAKDMARNPFAASVSVVTKPKPLPKPVVVPKVVEEKVEPEKVETTVENTEPQEPTPAEPPKPKFVQGLIKYVFQQRNSSGKTVAIVSIQVQGENDIFNETVAVGDTIRGISINMISKDELGLTNADGKRIAIPIGKVSRVIMSAETEQ